MNAPTTPDPIEIAMEAEAAGAPPSGIAAEVLAKQSRLIGWQIASERAGFGLKLLTGAAGLATAMLLALMAWQASRASGLVIKPFSVPPALAQRGVTGEAVASRVMDRLALIQTAARSGEQQQKLASDGDETLSIEIPATGISLGQLEQWLRSKLGREQRLTGEVSLGSDGGLRLQSRLGGQPLPTQTGTEAELDEMVTRTVEAIYARAQPQSWVLYLGRQNRWAEVLEYGRQRTLVGSRSERASGYLDMGRALIQLQGADAADNAFGRALRLGPELAEAWGYVAEGEYARGRDERVYRLRREALRRFEATPNAALSDAGRKVALGRYRSGIAVVTGDYVEVLSDAMVLREANCLGCFGAANSGIINVAGARAWLHDIGGAREELTDFGATSLGSLQQHFTMATVEEDWPRLLATTNGFAAQVAQMPDGGVRRMRWRAARARALAMLGRNAEAEAELALTPLDCLPCVIVRGVAAEQRGDRRTADHWFAEAVRIAPSIPFPNQEWARVRLARGDARGALARFDAALGQSPRYPDAVEGRGEALLALGDGSGAATAFSDAAKAAPKWGRLHLKWGLALAKQGKAAEAQAAYRTAAALYLTPAERAELGRLMR